MERRENETEKKKQQNEREQTARFERNCATTWKRLDRLNRDRSGLIKRYNSFTQINCKV